MSSKKLTHLQLLSLHFCLLISSGMITGHENGTDVRKVVVKEDWDALLPCFFSTREDIVQTLFGWKKDGQKEVFQYEAGIHYNNGRTGQDNQFKGRVSHFQDELKHGNASIIIRNTQVADSGDYTCDFPHLQPSQISHIKLVVERTLKDRSGEMAGAAPVPFITIADVTELGVQLKCDVRGGFPQPELQWKDSDGKVLPAEEPRVSQREGRYNVTLQTTVTKTTTNRFHCVASQKEIGHMIYAEVAVSERLFVDTCGTQVVIGGVIGFSLGLLSAVAVLLLLQAVKRIQKQWHKGSIEEDTFDPTALPLSSAP